MDRAVQDIFHPLGTSLQLRECNQPPDGIGFHSQSVYLKDKIYLGGGYNYLSTNRRSLARLYVYTPATDTWNTLDTPVYNFALTTYHSKLVLVGGREYVGENVEGSPSNKIWTLTEDGHWVETLPPMETSHLDACSVSHGDHLLVIDGDCNEARLYSGKCWTKVQHLPEKLHMMKSTIINGYVYVIGKAKNEKQNKVYNASLDCLISSCQSSEFSQSSSMWRRLPEVPGRDCYPAVFGDRLIGVDFKAIFAYSPSNNSWINVGKPSTLFPVLCAAVVLPSNELMVIGVKHVVKVTLNMVSFNPDSNFTMTALSLVEVAGIPLISSLDGQTVHNISTTAGVNSILFNNADTADSMFSSWIQNGGKVPPTWKNLLNIIRDLQLKDLAHEIEIYLRTGTVKHHTKKVTAKAIEAGLAPFFKTLIESQNSILADIKFEEVRRNLDNDRLVKGHPLFARPSVEEEVEEKPLAVWTEVEEEVVTVTKDEQTSSQPTAAWNLRGVEVCGEMTVVVHNCHAQQITWEGFGLKLHIDEGSLPAGIHQCTISIKASLAGQYEFPDNSHLVSAIFWLRCDPMCKFTKPVTVEMQHCARSENVVNLKLKFVRAVCSQKHVPYTFKQIGGDFTRHSSYGVIEVNGFSGLAITQEVLEDREYCSKLFYLSNYFSGHRIDFVVTWNTETHLRVMEKHYKEKGAHAGPDQSVDFVQDEIRLDLPMEETIVNNTWIIVPLIDPVVNKKEVDSYLPGKRIPHCTLEVHPIGDSVTRLVHRIVLLGAKPPRNMFMLSYSPPTPVQEVNRPAMAFPESAKPKLKDLLRELSTKVANDWEDIGIQLDIEVGVLKQIKLDNVGDSKACLREMLRVWLSRVDPPPSWSSIAEAIEVVGHEDIAVYLRKR